MRLLTRARLAWRVLRGNPNVTVLPYRLPTTTGAFSGGTYAGGTATTGTATWQPTR